MNTKPDPSAAELTSLCAEIQSAWSADERLRRLRSDERPTVQAADGRLVSVSAADYQAHLLRQTQ